MSILNTDTVVKNEGTYINYSINNPFYLYCQDYYRDYYCRYLAPCLQIADGSLCYKINKTTYSNQMYISTIGNGLVKKLFANGIDFSTDTISKRKMLKWAKQTHLLKELEKGWKYAFVGGTSLIKLNRSDTKKLYVSTHRIDTFYVDVLPSGEIVRATIYQDLIHATSRKNEKGQDTTSHYMLVEERKYNEQGKAVVKNSIFKGTATIISNNLERPQIDNVKEMGWTELPKDIRQIVKDRYPSVIIGKEISLPFCNDLGVRLWSWTTDNPRVPDLPFGQPAGDLLQSESRQYDQLKAFEEWEVKMAKAKAVLPTEYINQDDPMFQNNGMEDNFFTKIEMGGDNAQISNIQFNLRANEIRCQKENIIRDTSLKLNVSCSTIASFLNEGAGAKTATEIVNEKTTTDTFIKDQINLVRDDLNDLMNIVSRYLGCTAEVELIFRYENQNSHIDTLKIYSDAFNGGIVSPTRFVNDVFGYLSQEEKDREIEFMQAELDRRNQAKQNDLDMQQAQLLGSTTENNQYAPLRPEDMPSLNAKKKKLDVESSD